MNLWQSVLNTGCGRMECPPRRPKVVVHGWLCFRCVLHCGVLREAMHSRSKNLVLCTGSFTHVLTNLTQCGMVTRGTDNGTMRGAFKKKAEVGINHPILLFHVVDFFFNLQYYMYMWYVSLFLFILTSPISPLVQ